LHEQGRAISYTGRGETKLENHYMGRARQRRAERVMQSGKENGNANQKRAALGVALPCHSLAFCIAIMQRCHCYNVIREELQAFTRKI
jgi:hypothetical protein